MRTISIFCLGCLLFICSCNQAANKKQNDPTKYFDIRQYFDGEIFRLTKGSPTVVKLVEIDGISEKKTVKIVDWENELTAFRDAEINRSSWKGLFATIKNDDGVTYSSMDDKVPVKKVKITVVNGKVAGLEIIVKNENVLYSSIDTLFYYPDSLYLVKKQQNVRFLTKKKYLIEGRFK